MVKTSVYFRPDKREADLVRAGTLYLSRTSDHTMAYISFLRDDSGFARALQSTQSEAMRVMLSDFSAKIHQAVLASEFFRHTSDAEVVEAAFRLLPTNLKHDEIEPYPADDFFVRAVRELEEKQTGLALKNVLTEHGTCV